MMGKERGLVSEFDETALNLNSAWGDMVNAEHALADAVGAMREGNKPDMKWKMQEAGGLAELAVKKINWILQFGGE